MKKNIIQRLTNIFGLRSGEAKKENDNNFLYNHRLSRSVMEEEGHGKGFNGAASKFFIAMLIAGMAAMPFSKVLAAAFVTLDSFSGHPTILHVSGGGWTNGETVFLYFTATSGSPVVSMPVRQDGSFGPVNMAIPVSTPQGALSIIAVGSGSGHTESNSYYVMPFTPNITVAQGPTAPGSVVHISGSGFAPGETVLFALSGSNGGQTTADSNGNFTNATFTVPAVASATYQLHARGSSSGADAVFYFYIGGFFPTASPSGYYFFPGETLSFSGSGFAAGENITVTEGSSSTAISRITADASGAFANAGSVVLPPSLGGGVRTFHLTGNKGNVAADIMVTVGTFNGQISPSAYFVNSGEALSFSGHGFAPGETVDVFVGSSSTAAATFTAGTDGTFANAGATIIPFNFSGQTKTYTVHGESSNTTASVDITVGGFFPNISPSSYFVSPGQTFTISGSGFAPKEIVAVSLSGGTGVHVPADNTGNFSAAGPFTAPFSGGPLHVTATGALSGVAASVDVALGGLFPQVTPNEWYAIPGSSLQFIGSGFAPGETVAIASGGMPVGTVVATSTGNFKSNSIPVPFGAAGTKTYIFTGSSSGATTHVDITVAGLAPFADADTYYVTPGSVVHVAGHGFAGGEGITITLGSSSVHAIADVWGNILSTAITIPLGSANPAVITLTGDTSGVSAHVPITLAPFYPQVTPDTWYTAPGTTVHFSGSGFANGETVNVVLNGSPSTSTTANATGTITISVIIPHSSSAAHFVFTGEASGASAAVDVGLSSFSPQLTPSSWYVAAGSSVSFSGSGFAPGETLTENYNSITHPFTIASDGKVSTTPIAIPFTSTSAHFMFTSSVTHISSSFDIGVASLNPGIWLSTYYDQGGKPLTVFGGGFAGNEIIHIAFGGTPLGDATTDANGNFALVTTVPFASAGTQTVQARGNNSNASAIAIFTEPQVYSSVQLGSYAGAPGDAVTFIGSGFLPTEPIIVTTNRTGNAHYSFTADSTGSFRDSGWTIPLSVTGGPLTITIVGAHSFTSSSILYYVTGP